MPETRPGRLVHRVVDAIAAAAHDIVLEHEHDYRILHFFDTDVLYATVFGYRAMHDVDEFIRTKSEIKLRGVRRTPPSEAEYRGLLRALLNFSRFSTEIDIPDIRMLQPHLSEWTTLLVDRPPQDDKRTVSQLLDQLGTGSAIKELVERANGGELEKYLDQLTDVGPEIFINFDLLAPKPKERSLYLLDNGIAEETRFDFGPEILSYSEVRLVEQALHRRSPSRTHPTRELATMRDVAAIVMLIRGVDESRDKGLEFPLARFYTETDAMRHVLFRDRSISQRCTYHQSSTTEEWPTSTHSVLRDEFYYLLRLVVPGLSFDVSKASVDSDFIRRITEVAEVASTSSDESEVYAALSSVQSGNGSLAEIVDELADLSFVERVWPEWRQHVAGLQKPNPLVDLAASISGLSEFDIANAKQLAQAIDNRLSAVQQRTEDFAAFSEVYVDAFSSVGDLYEEAVSLAGSRSRLSDALGLGRFGVWAAEGHVVRHAQHLLSSLEVSGDLKTSEADKLERCRRLARSLASAATLRAQDSFESFAALAVLFALFADRAVAEAYDPILREIGENGDGGDEIAELASATRVLGSIGALHASLRNARGRDAHRLAAEAVRKASEDLLADVDGHGMKLDDATRLLALARLHFDGWYAQHLRSGAELADADKRDDSLLEQAFALIEPALGAEIAERSDVYAWVVNFALFGMTVSDRSDLLSGASPSSLTRELVALHGAAHRGAAWSYRFADTLAYHHFREAIRSDGDAGTQRERIREAHRWIDEACKMGPLDKEVQAHADEIRNFSLELADDG